MKEIQKYYVYPSNLDKKLCFNKVLEFWNKNNFYEIPDDCASIKYDIKISQNRTIIAKNYSEFMDILSNYPQTLEIDFHTHWKNKKTNQTIVLILTI